MVGSMHALHGGTKHYHINIIMLLGQEGKEGGGKGARRQERRGKLLM